MQQAQHRPPIALVLAGLLVLALAFKGPIIQVEGYHHFADQRFMFGIAHVGDVLSNLGFLLAGVWALVRSRTLEQRVFSVALMMTAFGSAWYHLAPDNARLVWDRLPIALACAALLAESVRESYRVGGALWWLLAAAVASVAWWAWMGDLRPYLLIQLAPLVLIPVLQWEARAELGRRKAFGVAIGLYVLAKVCEVSDAHLFEFIGLVSGHTLKHVLATMAALVLAYQFGKPWGQV